MGILDDIPGILSAAAGDLLFTDATLKTVSGRTTDGRGGWTQSTTSTACKALVTDYSAFMRATAGIGSDERKVIILGHELGVVPEPEDTVTVEGKDWRIIEVSRDPASATYECRAK